MPTALTRGVSPAMNECELTHLERTPIDTDVAALQHADYEACLTRLGCDVVRLPAEPDMPDSVFVEDTAVVFDELAVMARPGAASRRGELEGVSRALRPLRPLSAIGAPGTLDGGDVMIAGRRVFVGLSGRTNQHGLSQLRSLAEPLGYEVTGVPVRACLHLKSAVSELAEGLLLVNREWVDAAVFRGHELLDVAPSEPGAANALRLGVAVVFPARFPLTRRRLESAGLAVEPVDVSELAKAEGGVTCCSLIL